MNRKVPALVLCFFGFVQRDQLMLNHRFEIESTIYHYDNWSGVIFEHVWHSIVTKRNNVNKFKSVDLFEKKRKKQQRIKPKKKKKTTINRNLLHAYAFNVDRGLKKKNVSIIKFNWCTWKCIETQWILLLRYKITCIIKNTTVPNDTDRYGANIINTKIY